MHTHFKHLLLRRYLLAFGSLFDDMTLTREDTTGAEVYRQTVPLEYGPKERWLTRLTQDPDFLQGVAQIVPRISYEMTSLQYNAGQKINTLEQLTLPGTTDATRARLYAGVPYTIGVRLSVLTKLQQDGMQIVEQILPYFTPDWTIAVRPLADFPTFVDTIPITLQSVTHSDNYEGNFETRRAIVWDLDFTMKVYFYGPVRTKGTIQEVFVNIYNSTFEDLSAPTAFALPEVTIYAVPSPPNQDPDSTLDITADVTITENWTGLSPSPSRSVSPSASASPSA
tara:strand:+ start:1945 stop:2790 length:846 start_codon:yes stop_codon:yes gene_type:complete